MESLKNLPLVGDDPTPLSAAAVNFYQTNIALGSGPNGTFLLQDFFGLAAGLPGNAALAQAQDLIEQGLASGVLSDLDDIYSRMRELVTGTYTDPGLGTGDAGFIVIPSGFGSGSYSTYDSAMDALLIEADSAIGVIRTTLADTIIPANTTWTALSRNLGREQVNLDLASIDYETMPSDSQLPITSFIASLDSYGQDTQQGMSADILENIADITTITGQALIGAMREGRNNQDMDSTSVGHDNTVPDVPLTPPPQAQLLDSQYTVSQARARVLARLSQG
jgi:hypothetical protein